MAKQPQFKVPKYAMRVHGAIMMQREERTMKQGRRLNSNYPPEGMARTGSAKHTTIPAPAHGMKRRTVGDLAAYHHGVSVDDEPNTVKSFTNAAPVHSGMTDKQRAAHDPSLASAVLHEAKDLGRKPVAPRGEKA